MRRQNHLGQDPIRGLVFRLAIPSMIAQLVNVLYSIIDRIYIGNIPIVGDTALAGAGVCGPIVTLLSSFGLLVGLGGSILMAMKMGEGDLPKARQILSNSFLMLVVLSLVLTVLFLLSKEQLLWWFGASKTTFPYADTYMTIYTAGTFFALMAMGLNYFITCQGFSMVGMGTVLIGAVCNIVLDPVFIFGFQMGVGGAAVATVISQFASCFFVLCFLAGKRVQVSFSFGGYSLKLMRKIAFLGLSPFLIMATDSVMVITMNTVLQRFGGPGLGDQLITCATIVQSFFLLISSPMCGITGGTQAILSFNYGARQSKRVMEAEKWTLCLCLAFASFMVAMAWLIPQVFVSLFTQDPEIIQLSIWGIRVFTLGMIPVCTQYTFVDGFTAVGRAKTALPLSMSRKINYCLLTVLFPAIWGAKAAFYAEPVTDLIASILSTTFFLLMFKKHLLRREQEWQ